MRDDSDFPHQIICEFHFFKKNWLLLNSPNINKNLLFEVIIVFCYFVLFSYIYVVCWGLCPWKKDFTSDSLLLFTKKLGRSSYDITMTHYNVTLILFSIKFIVNIRDL